MLYVCIGTLVTVLYECTYVCMYVCMYVHIYVWHYCYYRHTQLIQTYKQFSTLVCREQEQLLNRRRETSTVFHLEIIKWESEQVEVANEYLKILLGCVRWNGIQLISHSHMHRGLVGTHPAWVGSTRSA